MDQTQLVKLRYDLAVIESEFDSAAQLLVAGPPAESSRRPLLGPLGFLANSDRRLQKLSQHHRADNVARACDHATVAIQHLNEIRSDHPSLPLVLDLFAGLAELGGVEWITLVGADQGEQMKSAIHTISSSGNTLRRAASVAARAKLALTLAEMRNQL